MNRSVLIVTPFFPPQNHAAVFRAYKLAKYLPAFGWKPVVLTVDTHYEFTEDDSLLAALPKEVEIVRTRYVEPTLRGLRMSLGGRDRTFHGSRKSANARGNDHATTGKPSTARKAYQSFLTAVNVPDSYWTWARTATRTGTEIIRERGIDLVLTTAAPYSSLVVGRALQRAGAKWVADFRDPLTYTQRMSSQSASSYERQKTIVKGTLANADAVTLLSSSYRSIFFDMFGPAASDPIFIPTGMDTALLNEHADGMVPEHPFLLFAGEYLSDFDTSFLEAFASALENAEVRSTGIKLLVVGTLELNRRRMLPKIEKFNLNDRVQFIDQLPQGEVYRLLKRALAGVLIPGSHGYWWTNFAKMTDYIGMRKPVIAVVPDPSEARTALTRSGLGTFLDGSPLWRNKTLTDFLLGKHKAIQPDENECDRYTAHRQVQAFVKVFESLSQSRSVSKQ
jgi:glycosyltransferase involved in cell wall biosynthesis